MSDIALPAKKTQFLEAIPGRGAKVDESLNEADKAISEFQWLLQCPYHIRSDLHLLSKPTH